MPLCKSGTLICFSQTQAVLEAALAIEVGEVLREVVAAARREDEEVLEAAAEEVASPVPEEERRSSLYVFLMEETLREDDGMREGSL